MSQGRARGYQVFAPYRTECDIGKSTDISSFLGEVKPDYIINAAAYVNVPACEADATEAFRVNAGAVRYLAREARVRAIPFVTYSTDYVFDGRKGEPYCEIDQQCPVQMYGITKYAGELAAITSYEGGTYILRVSGLYGGVGSPTKGNFILAILKEAQKKDRLEVSCEQIVSPTYARDASVATFELLERQAEAGIYHLNNEGFASWFEIACEIIRLASLPATISPIDRGGLMGDVRKPLFSALKNERAAKFGIVLPHWKPALEAYMRFLAS